MNGEYINIMVPKGVRISFEKEVDNGLLAAVRVEALAKGLGLSFQDGQYLRTVKPVSANIYSSSPKLRRRRGSKHMDNGVTKALRELEIGQTYDMSNEIARLELNPKQFNKRLRIFKGNSQHKFGVKGEWEAVAVDGRVHVKRVA